MSEITWSENLSVGVEVLDEQHRELVSITDRLFKAIMNDQGFDVLMGLLGEVADYAAYHFDYEENLLREHGYPEAKLAEHIQEHEILKGQVGEFIRDCEKDHATLDIDVFSFLRDWTTDHLNGTDKQYASFFAALDV